MTQRNRNLLALLLALMLTGMGATLYDLQVVNGRDYYEQSQRKIAETETVEAARGQILDRNGRVLVSNEVVYQVTLDTSLMEEDRNEDGRVEDDRNGILLSLIQIAREEGVEWSDDLPISQTEPFVFTTDSPYYTTSTNDDGETVRTLTRLGRFAVSMNWISDPTQEPEAAPVQEPQVQEDPSLWDRIKAFFTGEDLTTQDVSSAPVQDESGRLLTAEELLGKLCSYFQIKGEGAVDEKQAKASGTQVPTLNIGDMDPEDARAVAAQLGIPHYTLDLSDRFAQCVMDPFAAEYEAGRTPNPCVVCNRKLKFGALLDKARALGWRRTSGAIPFWPPATTPRWSGMRAPAAFC